MLRCEVSIQFEVRVLTYTKIKNQPDKLNFKLRNPVKTSNTPRIKKLNKPKIKSHFTYYCINEEHMGYQN